MFGFACDDTPELMPAPIMFAHRLGRELTRIRKSGKAEWLRPGVHLSSVNRTELAPPVFEKVTRLVVNAREGGKSFTARNSPEIGGFNQGDVLPFGVADLQSAELKDMV
jgi:hypothetical protein